MSQVSAHQPVTTSHPRFVFFVGGADAIDGSAADLAERWNVAVRVVHGGRCRTKQTLFREWSAALQFPSYFGENWDAFDECIRDLSWLRRKHCAVYVTHFDRVLPRAQDDFNTLLSIMHEAALDAGRIERGDLTKLAFFMHCPPARERVVRERLIRAQVDLNGADWVSELPLSLVLSALELAP